MASPSFNETLRGQTSGVFVVLLIITIMPKGLGNLLAVLVGAASYLLLLIFRPLGEPPVEEVCQKAASGCTANSPVDSASDDDDDDVVKEEGDGSGAGDGGRGAEQAEVPGSTEPPRLDESLQEELAKLKKDTRGARKNRARFQDFLQELMQSDAEAVPAPAVPEVHQTEYAEAREQDALVQQQAAAAGPAGSPDQQHAPGKGVRFVEAQWTGDQPEVTLAAFPVMVSPANHAYGPPPMYGFHLAGLGRPACVPFSPLRAQPPPSRLPPPAPVPEQQNWEECWKWVSRGWCPKGPACKWAHPRDQDTGPVFYHSIKVSADSGKVPATPGGDTDNTSGGGRVEKAGAVDSEETTNEASVDASDPDAILTDDGF